MYPAPEPAPDSYGTPEGVAALAGTWTNGGIFNDADAYTEASNPSLTNVVLWIDQVSGILNTILATYGFNPPLTKPNSLLAADFIVNRITADLVDYARSKGRFVSAGFVKGGMSVWQAVMNDISAWVQENAPGLEANGEDRGGTALKIGVRSHDENGSEMFPIFQREAFGNKFDNWSKHG